jgi:hypothetical protein
LQTRWLSFLHGAALTAADFAWPGCDLNAISIDETHPIVTIPFSEDVLEQLHAWLLKQALGPQPQFKDLEELNRFAVLVMGLCNEIASCFEQPLAPLSLHSMSGRSTIGRSSSLVGASSKRLAKRRYMWSAPCALRPRRQRSTRTGYLTGTRCWQRLRMRFPSDRLACPFLKGDRVDP